MILASQGGCILKRFAGTGVYRMRRRGRVNQRIAMPLFQELLGIGEHFSFALVVWRGKVDEGFAQYTAHASGFGFFGDSVLEIIHISECGDTSANLFRGCQSRSPADEFFVHVLGFGGKDVFVEPVV